MDRQLALHASLAKRSCEPDHVIIMKRLGVSVCTARKLVKDPLRLTLRQLKALGFTKDEIGELL